MAPGPMKPISGLYFIGLLTDDLLFFCVEDGDGRLMAPLYMTHEQAAALGTILTSASKMQYPEEAKT